MKYRLTYYKDVDGRKRKNVKTYHCKNKQTMLDNVKVHYNLNQQDTDYLEYLIYINKNVYEFEELNGDAVKIEPDDGKIHSMIKPNYLGIYNKTKQN